MMPETTVVVDEAIRVVVTPSQASYFAGEPFSVSITITNTRTSEESPPRSASHSAPYVHKRHAHSISSVPLARPPTSPGTRNILPVFPAKTTYSENGISRRNYIGKDIRSSKSTNGGLNGSKRPTVVTKSLSVSIAPEDLATQLKEDAKGKMPARPLRAQDSAYPSPTSPRISSPLARSASVPVNHPHARKQSVLDGQLQLQDLRPPASLSPFASTPNASTSTFSLSLDSIAEGGSSPLPPITPSFPSPIPETASTDLRTHIPTIANTSALPAKSKPDASHAYPPRPTPSQSQSRRPPQLGLGHGHPPSSSSLLAPPRTAFSSTFPVPNTELILYSYAQIIGTLSMTPLPGTASTIEQARTLNTVRTSLLKQQGIGGGSMDIASLNSPSPGYGGLSSSASSGAVGRRRGPHGRSSSLSTGLLSLLSTSSSAPSLNSPQGFTPSHRARTPSVFSGLFSPIPPSQPNGSGGVVGLGITEEEPIDPETPLPTFEVQPTMIAVDLSLGPGESRSYTYTIPLPENLPPTFRGRTLKFSYQFILGICRAGSGPASALHPGSSTSRSRVMKVPIRVYNYVTVGRPPTPYDLLWPVGLRKRTAHQQAAQVVECQTRLAVLIPPSQSSLQVAGTAKAGVSGGTYDDLQAYARSLLVSTASLNTSAANDRSISTRPSLRPPIGSLTAWPNNGSDFRNRAEDEMTVGCREAVEILTRNPRKLSYDVNKDGVKVAVLTFTKSAYRLGETVLGVVELNEKAGRARVLKLSALLEAHESLPGCIASSNNSRHMRRVHAEQHSSYMACTLRTTFSLDIPPDASPAFQVDVQGDGTGPLWSETTGAPGGLEWKVRLCLLVAVASPNARADQSGVKLKSLVRDGSRGEWGSSWKAATTIAPMERPDLRPPANGSHQEPSPTTGTAKSWMSFLTTTFLGSTERGYHDGDEEIEDEEDTPGDEEMEMWGNEEEWREVKVEMVECEVPIKVWPGNTAFKATEVVFDV